MAGRRRSQKTEYYFDYSLLFIILFLTGFGLVMIYSASAYDATTQNLNEDYYLMHQAFAAALGLVGMFFVSHIPYHFWERFAVIGYVVSLILIALVLSPLGVEVNGARRWLNLGMSIAESRKKARSRQIFPDRKTLPWPPASIPSKARRPRSFPVPSVRGNAPLHTASDPASEIS